MVQKKKWYSAKGTLHYNYFNFHHMENSWLSVNLLRSPFQMLPFLGLKDFSLELLIRRNLSEQTMSTPKSVFLYAVCKKFVDMKNIMFILMPQRPNV